MSSSAAKANWWDTVARELRSNARGERYHLDPHDVVAFSHDSKYATALTRDGREHLLSTSLDKLLIHHPRFARVHRAHLVDPHYVTVVERGPGSSMHLHLCTGHRVPVARRNLRAVSRLLREINPPLYSFRRDTDEPQEQAHGGR